MPRDPRTANGAAEREKNIEKCPEEVLQHMANNGGTDAWLKVWLQRGGSWVQAKAIERKIDEDVDLEGRKRAWLTEGQMEKLFRSRIVVAALEQTYLSNSAWNRLHPDVPDCVLSTILRCHSSRRSWAGLSGPLQTWTQGMPSS